MKTGKFLKIAGAAASSLILLITLAACGQGAKGASQNKSSSSVVSTKSSSQSNASPSPSSGQPAAAIPPTASSSSASTASSSESASAVPWATSVMQSGNQSTDLLTSSATGIDYVLAYIKLEGGISNINPSTFLVDNMLIGRQGSESEWNSSNGAPMYQAGVDVGANEVTLTLYDGFMTQVKQKWIYNLGELKSEYYSTASQQEEVKNLLCQGEFNEIVDLAAYRKMWSANAGQKDVLQFNVSALSITGNAMGDMGNSGSYMMSDGGEVQVVTYPGMGAAPWTVSYDVESLIREYYSTAYWRTTLNSWVNNATQSFSSIYASYQEEGGEPSN
ncbi:MAG: hypothetical protein J6O89_02480 [Aeriscardovia sp.]|nr:hypothetical protein [Aeriscardovia sp.]